MTEQPPSAEALRIVEPYPLSRENWMELARRIDGICEQRVAVETERWQNRDRQRLEQIGRLQAALQSLQNARAERREQPDCGTDKDTLRKAERLWRELQDNELGGYSGINRPFWIKTYLDAERNAALDAAVPASPAAVGDYTERARELLRRIGDAHGRETQSRYYEDNKPSVKLVVDALSAVASEVAYQAGSADAERLK